MQPPQCRGCSHCLQCLPVSLTYELCDTTRRNQLNEPYQPWWPASIDSPTLYFQLKRRALAHLFREQARAGFSDPATWRAAHTSAACGSGNALLARRGGRQLSVRLPTARTNLSAADSVEFVCCVSLSPSARPAALQQAQQQQPQQQPLPMEVQQQQQAQQQCAAVARPRARRPVPLPPAAPAPRAPLCAQEQLQAAAAAQQLQASMNLLASLHYQEQCHRQQLAAAAAPSWAAASSVFVAAEAHPAAFLRPASASAGWQCSWQAQQQQQQQQLAATAAPAASWPFAVPQAQWSFGCADPAAGLQLQSYATTTLQPATGFAAPAAC